MVDPLGRRLLRLGLSDPDASALVGRARADGSGWDVVNLDAAIRATEGDVSAGRIGRGAVAQSDVTRRFDCASRRACRGADVVPAALWSAQRAIPADAREAEVTFRGAVLLVVRGGRSPNGARP
jgi:hypothetical protein